MEPNPYQSPQHASELEPSAQLDAEAGEPLIQLLKEAFVTMLITGSISVLLYGFVYLLAHLNERGW